MNPKILAVDFDQTVCDTTLLLGPPVPFAFNWLKQFQADGHKLILWTNRTGPLLWMATTFCGDYGLKFDEVNRSLHWWERLVCSPKILVDYYLDDRNIGTPLMAGQGTRKIIDWGQYGPMVDTILKGTQ